MKLLKILLKITVGKRKEIKYYFDYNLNQETLLIFIDFLGDLNGLEGKIDYTLAKVDGLTSKLGSNERKLNRLESTHQQIKGKIIQHLFFSKIKKEKKIETFLLIIFYAEFQVDLDEKIGDVLKYVDGLKSGLSGSDIAESQDVDGLKSDLSESDITKSQDFDGLKSDLSGSDVKESQDTYNLVDTFKNEIHEQTV